LYSYLPSLSKLIVSDVFTTEIKRRCALEKEYKDRVSKLNAYGSKRS